MPPAPAILRRRWLPWAALALAAVAGAALRFSMLERLSPREFSYMIESCFRFRYAEMRMHGHEPPKLDAAAQWPEGFAVDRMILPLPDRTVALFYRLRGGGDTFLASRALIITLSALGVCAFAPLALAVFRRPWPAAGAALFYAGTYGAYSRSVGNYLREDFAMPGLLLATAGVVYLLTGGGGRRRWLVAGGVALATAWAGSCWHMSQFYCALLAAGVVAFGLAGRGRAAALAGAGLWLGLFAAAALNKPLWSKGAMWNASAALALAPAAAWLLARALRREAKGRWFLAATAAALVGASLAFGRSQDYGHVFALLWAKAVHLGRRPAPAALSPDARLFWAGPYNSPGRTQLALEYGLLAFPFAAGLVLWLRDLFRRRRALAARWFVAAAAVLSLTLYLLMARLTVFLAPWLAVVAVYPAWRAGAARARAAWLAPLVVLWGLHVYGTEAVYRPGWFRDVADDVAKPPLEVAWFYGTERVDFLMWLATAAPPGPVLADFAVSPPILYLTGHATALNPMFEVPAVRRKALAYAEAAAADEETFYRLCRKWRVRYVVHFAPQVLSRGNGSFYNATGREVGADAAAAGMQFGPERLRRFRLVYESYSLRVFEVGRPYDGFVSPAYHPLFDPTRFGAVPRSEAELLGFYGEMMRAQEYYGRGVALQEREAWGGAAAAFTSCLRLHPDFEDAALRLGFCHLQLGQNGEAARWMERAAASRPGDPRPARYLALLGSRR